MPPRPQSLQEALETPFDDSLPRLVRPRPSSPPRRVSARTAERMQRLAQSRREAAARNSRDEAIRTSYDNPPPPPPFGQLPAVRQVHPYIARSRLLMDVENLTRDLPPQAYDEKVAYWRHLTHNVGGVGSLPLYHPRTGLPVIPEEVGVAVREMEVAMAERRQRRSEMRQIRTRERVRAAGFEIEEHHNGLWTMVIPEEAASEVGAGSGAEEEEERQATPTPPAHVNNAPTDINDDNISESGSDSSVVTAIYHGSDPDILQSARESSEDSARATEAHVFDQFWRDLNSEDNDSNHSKSSSSSDSSSDSASSVITVIHHEQDPDFSEADQISLEDALDIEQVMHDLASVN